MDKIQRREMDVEIVDSLGVDFDSAERDVVIGEEILGKDAHARSHLEDIATRGETIGDASGDRLVGQEMLAQVFFSPNIHRTK